MASRRARYHYGVCVDEIFDEKEHNPKSRYTDDMDECHRAADQMRYFLEKGDEVKANESVCNVTLEFACKADEIPEDIIVTLYATEQIPAPKEWSPSIGRLCELVINVADLPKKCLEAFRTQEAVHETHLRRRNLSRVWSDLFQLCCWEVQDACGGQFQPARLGGSGRGRLWYPCGRVRFKGRKEWSVR